MPTRAAVRNVLVVTLGVIALGGSARAVDYNPPVVAWGPNRLDVFAVGLNDGHLWHTSFNGVAWQSAWDDRGAPEPGRIPGAVSVVSWGLGRLDIFMGGGTYQNVWHTAWNGSTWQAWDDQGHPGSGTAATLSAVSWGPNRLDVFTVDTRSRHLWQLTWNGSMWIPWTDRGAPAGFGPLNFDAKAVSWGPNRIDVFATIPQTFPMGGTVWHTAWNGSNWQGWDSRGAPPNGAAWAPVAVSWGPGRLDVFTFSNQQPGNTIEWDCWHDSWNGSNWETTWDDRGAPPLPSGMFAADLNAVSWGPNRLDVFGVAPSTASPGNLDLWHNSWDGYAWQAAWDERGSPMGQGAVRSWAVSWGDQRLDVFSESNGRLWHLAWNGSAWLPWENLGAPPSGFGD